ncbi:MAG: putative toxin-antitoxin system toxin component, PIN family [Zavarzinella sp.]|nr:putative toxin-antitoxin system toxin component, PIN family [Zavarzinella sp.]
MSSPPPPTVVFDCMTFLQATTSPTGLSAACLRLVEAGYIRLVVSQPILDEVRNVLSRPRIRKRNPHLTGESVDAFLARVAAVATVAPIPPSFFPYARNPKDEPYLNLAIGQTANLLASWDNDLLDLMKPDNEDGSRLRSLAPTLAIVTPPGLLAVVSPPSAIEPP